MLIPHAEWREIISRADRMMSQLKYKIVHKGAYSATHEVSDRLHKAHKLPGEYTLSSIVFATFACLFFTFFLPIFEYRK